MNIVRYVPWGTYGADSAINLSAPLNSRKYLFYFEQSGKQFIMSAYAYNFSSGSPATAMVGLTPQKNIIVVTLQYDSTNNTLTFTNSLPDGASGVPLRTMVGVDTY